MTHLYVKPCKPAASAPESDSNRQWHHWSSGAGLGAVLDQHDLPGPQGTKQLHLRKKEGVDEEELDTVGPVVMHAWIESSFVSIPNHETS